MDNDTAPYMGEEGYDRVETSMRGTAGNGEASPFRQSWELLSSQVDVLDKAVAHLADRIEPALSMGEPTATDEPAKMTALDASSSLTTNVRRLTERLRDTTSRLVSLQTRVEL